MNADDIVALEPYDYENKILAQWEDEGVLIVLRADSHKRRLKKDDFVTAIASWKDPAGNSKSFEGPYRIEFKDGNFALVQDWWAARYFDAKPKDADAIHAIAVVKRIIGEEAPAAAAAHKLKLVVERHRQELLAYAGQPSETSTRTSGAHTDLEHVQAMANAFMALYPESDLDLPFDRSDRSGLTL